MLPITLLKLAENDIVLDMCASPGSKTLQILEKLHQNSPLSSPGVCIACEIDEKRASMLAHQTIPLGFPGLAIFNGDSTKLPLFSAFDKVLCDVPCSGDGTTRKNGLILKNWSPKFATKLHKTQRNLLISGLKALKTGGLLLYSTCSLNVIENEAVVLSVIGDDSLGKHVELLDIDAHWPQTLEKPRWKRGLSQWKVFARVKKQGFWLEKFEELPKECRSGLEKTMFSLGELQKRELLARTRRIYPHFNDTGGFFLALFRKNSDFHEFPSEFPEKEEEKADKTEENEEKVNENSLKVADFRPIDEKLLVNIRDFYGFSQDFPEKLLFSASPSKFMKTLPKRLVFVNKGLRDFWEKLQANAGFLALKTVSFGLNAFKFIREEDLAIKYRALCESSQILLGFLQENSPRLIKLEEIKEFRALMTVKSAKKVEEIGEISCFSKIKALSQGPFLVILRGNQGKAEDFKGFMPCLVFWKGISHINLLMKTQDLTALSLFLAKTL